MRVIKLIISPWCTTPNKTSALNAEPFKCSAFISVCYQLYCICVAFFLDRLPVSLTIISVNIWNFRMYQWIFCQQWGTDSYCTVWNMYIFKLHVKCTCKYHFFEQQVFQTKHLSLWFMWIINYILFVQITMYAHTHSHRVILLISYNLVLTILNLKIFCKTLDEFFQYFKFIIWKTPYFTGRLPYI